MNDSEKFCLKWNDFETNIQKSFRGLRENQEFADVTLVSDDGHQFDVHKVILSSGSQLFSEILRKSKHPNPFIYLKGINRVELEYVLDFLYNGEAYIAQEKLNTFLETAQELKVEGLQSQQGDAVENNQIQENHFVVSKSTTANDAANTTPTKSDAKKLYTPEELPDTFDTNEIVLIQYEDESPPANMVDELDVQIEQMSEMIDGLWKCKVCGKSAKHKSHLRDHAETHLEGVSHTCHICNKSSSTRKALKVHVNNYHSQMSFDCNICGNVGMTKIAFKNHKRICKI